MRGTKIAKIIFILSIAGVLIASYSLYDHYQPIGKGVCNLSETINCDIVNKGPYSEIFGIPIALFGVLLYLALAKSAFFAFRKEESVPYLKNIIFYLSGFGLIFSLALGSFVYYMLGAVCPVCILSYITIALIFFFSLKLKKSEVLSPPSL